MKFSLIILCLLLDTLFASDELSWVDEQVQAIKPPRDGMHQYQFAKIKDPFIFLKKNRDSKDDKKRKRVSQPYKSSSSNIATSSVTSSHANSYKKGLRLQAILNKSVMINGVWYKLHANVHGYTISNISRKSVLLTKNKKSFSLTTRTLNTNIKFQK